MRVMERWKVENGRQKTTGSMADTELVGCRELISGLEAAGKND